MRLHLSGRTAVRRKSLRIVTKTEYRIPCLYPYFRIRDREALNERIILVLKISDKNIHHYKNGLYLLQTFLYISFMKKMTIIFNVTIIRIFNKVSCRDGPEGFFEREIFYRKIDPSFKFISMIFVIETPTKVT